MSTLSALRHTADAVTAGGYPYVYGGGTPAWERQGPG